MRISRSGVPLAILCAACDAWAGGGVFGIDHRVSQEESGLWSRHNQIFLEYGVIVTELGGALWYGRDSEIGRAFWQSIDASVIAGVGAQGLKYAFGRERPAQTADPNQWFKGRHAGSFPSGEVTLQAAFVTPLISRYHNEQPWIWALEVLPAYDAIARVKSQAHWQSDVLAGWALGSAVGYWTGLRTDSPFSVQILPNAVTVGWRTKF